MSNEYQDLHWQSDDGLTLFAKNWTCTETNSSPLLCLAGLTRNSNDFDDLARSLSKSASNPIQVIAMDYRGRGQSDYDRENSNYTFERELKDIIAGLDSLQIETVDILGTSRGGLHAILMSTFYPNRVGKVILNDIGPDISEDGINRIKEYVGIPVNFANQTDAASHLKGLFGTHFPLMTDLDWIEEAKRTYKVSNSELVLNYDPNLRQSFIEQSEKNTDVDLWALFKGLANKELMVIHGVLSNILTEETIEKMKQEHPNLRLVQVQNQGHPPQLRDEETQEVIASFLKE